MGLHCYKGHLDLCTHCHYMQWYTPMRAKDSLIGPHSTYPPIHPSPSFSRLRPTPHHCRTLLLSPGAPTPCSACPDSSPRTSGHSFLAPRALPSQGSRVLPVSDTSDALRLVWSSLHTPDWGQAFIPEAPTHSCLPSMAG